MVGADTRVAHRPRRLRGPTPILGPRVFLAVLVFFGVPGAFAAPCLKNERVENGLCVPCTGGGIRAAGDDPAAGDTGCAFPDRATLKAAVDSCIAAVPSGERCCSEGGADCGAAGLVDMPLWDVSQVTDMRFLFTYCDGWGWCEYNVLDSRSFNEDISGWDTSQVTDMQRMFFEAPKFNQPIGSWDTSQVTDMEYMFIDAGAFNQDISRWDTSSLTASVDMFIGATAWQARYVNCGWQISGHNDCCGACSEFTSFTIGTGIESAPPSGWVRKDNACDAAVPPANGAAGDCTDTLPSGSTCQPT